MNSTKESSLSLKPLEEILASMPDPDSSDLIPILQKIQNQYGYLPPEVLMEMSDRTGIAASHVYGVVTFYEQFHLQPRGRHTVRCCRGTACHVKGASAIIDVIKNELNVEEGGTAEDMRFTFETVACLGTCFLAPVVMIDNDYYGNLTAGKIGKIISKYD